MLWDIGTCLVSGNFSRISIGNSTGEVEVDRELYHTFSISNYLAKLVRRSSELADSAIGWQGI